MTEELRQGAFTQRCSQLSFGVLCLLLLECSITGGGRYWEVGPVSVRILLGGLAAVLALPELFRQVEIERYLFSREDRYLRTISAPLKTMA